MLSIIIVHYDGLDDTVKCIASLRAGTYQDFRIIVVDNCSKDKAAPVLRSAYPDISVVEMPENLGFSGGNNAGIRRALQESPDLVLLLNNDTVVRPDSIQILVDSMNAHPEAGIMGGKIYYMDRPQMLWFAGARFNRHSGSGYHLGLNEIDSGKYDTFRESDFITGCLFLVRREVLARVGLLDDTFFAYYEDADYCLRARLAGYKVYYEPRCVIFHKAHSTTVHDSPFYIYFTLRNKIFFLKKHERWYTVLPFLPALAYFYCRQFVRLFVKWRNIPSSKAAWYALVDGLKGYSGSNGRGRLDSLMAK